jgi:hypothetical protein
MRSVFRENAFFVVSFLSFVIHEVPRRVSAVEAGILNELKVWQRSPTIFPVLDLTTDSNQFQIDSFSFGRTKALWRISET